MHTQTSGFNVGGSMLNQTINSNMNSLMNTERIQRKTAREFFSKDNLNHPSIEENKQLHQ